MGLNLLNEVGNGSLSLGKMLCLLRSQDRYNDYDRSLCDPRDCWLPAGRQSGWLTLLDSIPRWSETDIDVDVDILTSETRIQHCPSSLALVSQRRRND